MHLTTVPCGDKATTAEADPVATRIPLSDEEDWKLVSKITPRKKRAVLYVGNFRKGQNESNLRQYISKRCLGLGNITAVFDTCSIQTKEEHANAHVLLSADAAQHLCRCGFWVHPIYARKWVFNEKPAAGVKNQQQGEGSGYQQQQQQQQAARDSERAAAVLGSAHSHSIGSPHDEELKLALSPESNWGDYSDSTAGVEEDVTAPAVIPARSSKRRNDHPSPSDLTEAKRADTNRDESLPPTNTSR